MNQQYLTEHLASVGQKLLTDKEAMKLELAYKKLLPYRLKMQLATLLRTNNHEEYGAQ